MVLLPLCWSTVSVSGVFHPENIQLQFQCILSLDYSFVLQDLSDRNALGARVDGFLLSTLF